MHAIRAAKPDDFPAIRALLAGHGLICADLVTSSLGAFAVVPAPDHPEGIAAVAGVEIFAGDAEAGLLRSVAVSPALRGRGVGAALVAACEERARQLGVRRLFLLTTTAPAFFRRLGYADTPRADAPAAVQQADEFRSLYARRTRFV